MNRLRFAAALSLAAYLLASSGQSLAQQNDDLGWSFEGEVSGIWAGGNSASRTVGADATITRRWARSLYRAQGGGLRTESTLKTRFAVGTADDFELQETAVTATTAEAYLARSSYEYRFSKKSFAIGGVDWLRNTFSGIDSRFLVGLGSGNTWIDSKKTKLETTYGFTYTFESEVVNNPFNTGKFPGMRLSYQLDTELSSSTDFRSRFAGDWNLDNTKDVRIDWTNSITVSIVSILALKPSLKLLWRNDPALTEVPLGTEEPQKTQESVFVPLKKLDTFLTLALVVTL